MNKTKYIDIINYLYEANLLPMYLAELISADNNTSKDCIEQHLIYLNNFLNVLSETKIEDKIYWEEKICTSINILTKEKN